MAERLVRNLRDDYLTCTICLEQYKTPKRLPCEHAFCEQCLIDHVTQTVLNGAFHCPVCRNRLTIEEIYLRNIKSWVYRLDTDTLLSSLLRTINVHEKHNDNIDYSGLNICRKHTGKAREVYCFTHAQLICWECAARQHGNCQIESASEAGHVIQPTMDCLKNKIDKHLQRSRDLCKNDQKFTESKAETMVGLTRLEKRLDTTFASAKKQILLLREEVEVHNRTHLEQRKGFYELVTFLLEMNATLETVQQSGEVVNALGVLEKLKEGVHIADEKMALVEASSTENSVSRVKFVLDDDVDRFLRKYSSVGFVDAFDESGADSPSGTEAPLSISHILRRAPSNTQT